MHVCLFYVFMHVLFIYLFTYILMSFTWDHHQLKLLIFLAVTPMNCHVTWREEFNASVPNIVRVVKSRRMRWAGHVARMGEGRGLHRVLVGKPEGKRPLGRPRHRWEDNIKMDLQEGGGSCGDWMELGQDRDRWRALVGTVRNLRVPKMRGIS